MQGLQSISQKSGPHSQQPNGSVCFRSKSSHVRVVYRLSSDCDSKIPTGPSRLHVDKYPWRLHDAALKDIFSVDEKRLGPRLQYKTYRRVNDVVTKDNLHYIIYQLVDCLHYLRYDMLILHRNVGVHSIMCEIRSDSVHAILTDFSRACHVSKTGEPFGIHEGWPSPSQDRLQSLEAQQSVVEEQSNPFHPDLSWVPGDVPHLLVYDYEGLLYTAVWCTCLPRRLRWRDRNFFPWYIIIHDVSDGRPFAERHHPLPEFRGYTKWMTAFWGLFCNARKAVNIMGRSASMHDQETAYGILTAEAIKEKLQAVPLCEEVGESKSD